MRHKLKTTLVLLLLFSLVACAGKHDETLLSGHEAENKIDYKKAALLNIELGYHYLEQGQVSRAKKKFLHAVELAPNLADAHASMGYFFETVGDAVMAEKHYRKAIFLGKGQGLFHNNYGIYLCGQGRFKEADKEFLLAVHDYNYIKTADAYENAGLCALKAQDLAKAENYFNMAVRYDPKQHNALLELATLHFKKGSFTQAQQYLQQVRSQVELTPQILWLAIQIAQGTKDHDAIASNALLLKNMFAESAEYRAYLASQE